MSLKGLDDKFIGFKEDSGICKGFEEIIKKIGGEHDDEIDFKIRFDEEQNKSGIIMVYFNKTKNPTRTFASYIESEKGMNLMGDFCQKYGVATIEYENGL